MNNLNFICFFTTHKGFEHSKALLRNYFYICYGSEFIHKSHNVSVLLYHFVCPAKYGRVVFDKEVDESLKEICLEISKHFEIVFIEIGTDKNHVNFLIQSVPILITTSIIQTVKSITAKQIFKLHPKVKKQLLDGMLLGLF